MEDIADMDPEERLMEQKMMKVIAGMPVDVQARFKVLHMLTNECSKITDLEHKAVNVITAKYFDKKKPVHDRRDLIIDGEITDFSAELSKFNF